MRPTAILTLLASMALSAPGRSALADEPKGDLAKLQGSWTTKSGPNKDLSITLSIKASKFEVNVKRPDGQEIKLQGDLKLDEKAEPKAYDFTNFKRLDGQEIPDNRGIYKLEGDTWITYSGGPGNDRPAKFEAGDGDPPNLATWTRVKVAAEDKPIKGDLGKFQGTWTAPAGPDDGVVITMTVKVNAYTARWVKEDGSKVELRGELRLNDQAAPNRTIDFFNTRREDGEDARDSLGIYEFDGEKIKLCVGNAGEERPTEFKRGDAGTPHLLVFARQKE